jgi:hypothetical protein
LLAGAVYSSGVSKEAEHKQKKKRNAQVVHKILGRVEAKLSKEVEKASLGDYIKLVQLEKELEEEEPDNITVTWVDPENIEK